MAEPQTTCKRFSIAAALAPVIMGAVATLLQVRVLPEAPHEVALHFDAGGPDGYGPAWTYPVLTFGLTVSLTVLVVVPVLISIARSPEGRAPVNLRLVSALIWATTAFFCVALTASLYLQRGIDDPSNMSGLGTWIGIGLGAALAAAVLGAIVAPRPHIARRDP